MTKRRLRPTGPDRISRERLKVGVSTNKRTVSLNMKICFDRRISFLTVAVGLAVSALTAGPMASASGSQIPVGGPQAGVTGQFGPVVAWPIIPIHVVLLPGGRVMNYGTGRGGQQGAEFIYDVWTPSLGTGTNAHLVLSNTTATDLFCSSASVMYNGTVLTTGGDLTVNGQRNFANNKTTLFWRSTNTIGSNTPMQYPRWYPSLVELPDGRLAVFGGYQNVVPPLNDPVIAAHSNALLLEDASVLTGGGGPHG